MKKEFLVVFEEGKNSFGAQAPDIPGCFAVGATLEETRGRFLEAARSHLEWLAAEHDPIPEPVTSRVEFERGTSAETPRYYVEWLLIAVPAESRRAVPA